MRANEHAQAFDGEPVGTLTLPHDERHLRRRTVTLDDGRSCAVDLPLAVRLRDGDALLTEDGAVVVRAATEALYRIEAGSVSLARLAWHIGNRHLAAQIGQNAIHIAADPVIRTMLEGLGAHVEDESGPFEPEAGAYHSHD